MQKAFLKYMLALLLFGSNGIVASCSSLSSSEIVLWRTALGALVLLSIFSISGQRLTVQKYKKDALFIGLSGAAMAADWLLLFEAYAQIGVSMGMLINYCGPAIVMGLAWLLFNEQLPWYKVLALAAALTGVLCISGTAASHGTSGFGLLCAVLSAGAYAAMVLCSRLAPRITGLENALLQLVSALIVVAVYVGCRQQLTLLLPLQELLPLFWLGVLNTGTACYLYFSAIKELPLPTVSICGYLEPLAAVLLAAILLQEALLPLQLLGAVLIIGGALLSEIVGHKLKSGASS